jgi:hypothetical protein
VIVFDESHAMQNAVGGKGERGDYGAPADKAKMSVECQSRPKLTI